MILICKRSHKVAWANAGVCIFAFFVSCGSLAQVVHAAAPEISIYKNKVYVNSPSGAKQVILLDHDIKREDVRVEDLTFNGYHDLKILNERGAAQEFYNVYLYSSSLGKYVFNKKLSDIPCLQVDAEKKQLVGACFHISACENWSEHYAVTRLGRVSLVARAGAYCDATGQVYSYVDHFKNGKQISSKVIPVLNVPQRSPD